MISFVYGTTAELIKIAPVYHRLVERGTRPLLWSTGQHVEELPRTAERLGLPQPDVELGRGRGGKNLYHTVDVAPWLWSVLRTVARRRRELEASLWSDDRPPIVLVHGDTMTTVLGAALGRWLGVTVGHIEAGLRTHRIFEPFPEELDRRVAARLAHVHYTPGIDKFGNLGEVRGVKVDTLANTVLDSLRLVPEHLPIGHLELPDRYGVVSLHRFELLHDPARFAGILDLLVGHADRLPMVVVTDAQTSAQIAAQGLEGRFEGTGLLRIDKQPYFEFVSLIRGAELVITDSGGLQEECAYLNIPCLVHRNTTERSEGLGANVVLSNYDLGVVERFLSRPEAYRAAEPAALPSPSELIVDHLERAGHVQSRRAGSPHGSDLAIVVAARGAAEFIRSSLQSAVRGLDETGLDYEIVVVSDGSRDGTVHEARDVDSDRVRVLHYADNAGRGFAFKYGFAQTVAKVVASVDPQLLANPDNIVRLVRLLDDGADVVAGSKTHAASSVAMSPGRRSQTAIWSSVLRRLFSIPVSDAQLGLKVYRRQVLEAVLPYTRSADFGFDIEVLATANDLGFRIDEAAVSIPGRMGSITNVAWLTRTGVGIVRLAVLRLQLARDRRAMPRPAALPRTEEAESA